MPSYPVAIKLAKKIARIAFGIATRRGTQNGLLSGRTQRSRNILLHAAALIVLKALNFKLPTGIISHLFTLLDSVSYIRIEDYDNLDVNVAFSL
jgi:hypothetical protein